MSRIGRNPITVPEGVTVEIKDNLITAKGKLGELTQEYSEIEIKIEEGTITLERSSDKKDLRAKHGLYRALIANMIEGVSKGWTKELEMVGGTRNRVAKFLDAAAPKEEGAEGAEAVEGAEPPAGDDLPES